MKLNAPLHDEVHGSRDTNHVSFFYGIDVLEIVMWIVISLSILQLAFGGGDVMEGLL